MIPFWNAMSFAVCVSALSVVSQWLSRVQFDCAHFALTSFLSGSLVFRHAPSMKQCALTAFSSGRGARKRLLRVKHKTKINRDGVKSEIDAVNEYLGSPDDKCDTAIEHSMKNAHSNCGANMKDSAEKLAQKSKSLTDKAVQVKKA